MYVTISQLVEMGVMPQEIEAKISSGAWKAARPDPIEDGERRILISSLPLELQTKWDRANRISSPSPEILGLLAEAENFGLADRETRITELLSLLAADERAAWIAEAVRKGGFAITAAKGCSAFSTALQSGSRKGKINDAPISPLEWWRGSTATGGGSRGRGFSTGRWRKKRKSKIGRFQVSPGYTGSGGKCRRSSRPLTGTGRALTNRNMRHMSRATTPISKRCKSSAAITASATSPFSCLTTRSHVHG